MEMEAASGDEHPGEQALPGLAMEDRGRESRKGAMAMTSPQSSSFLLSSEWQGSGNGMHFKLDGESVRDAQGEVVGRLQRPKFMSHAWWSNVLMSFEAVQDSALFHYANPRELHVSISAIGELFVIAGSLIAGFALQFFQIADLSQLALRWYMPISLFSTLAFLAGIACVVIAAMLFIGISTVPVSHVHVFANHLAWWLLRPGILMGVSFLFMGAAFTTISLRAPYKAAAWACLGLILFMLLLMVVISLELMQRIVCVRDFVKFDTKREIAARKRDLEERKLAARQVKRQSISKRGIGAGLRARNTQNTSGTSRSWSLTGLDKLAQEPSESH